MKTTSAYEELKPINEKKVTFENYAPKKQKQAQKNVLKKKNGCRGLHYSCHSPHLELEFCKTCDSYVQIRGQNICQCCEKTIPKFLKHTWLTRVLKQGIKQHRNFIRDWSRFPEQGVVYEKLKKPYSYEQKMADGSTKRIRVTERFVKKPRYSQFLEINYRHIVYEIEIKYLVMALEIVDADVIDPKTKKVVIKGGERAKLDMIKSNIIIKGFGLRIPEEEEQPEIEA